MTNSFNKPSSLGKLFLNSGRHITKALCLFLIIAVLFFGYRKGPSSSIKNIKVASPINIFFVVNDPYCKYLAVAMTSILLNTAQPLNFYIIDGGISEENKEKLEQLKSIRNFNIEYVSIDKKRFDSVPHNPVSRVSKDTNYRFLASSVKPELNKCIFLDADLVVDGDIKRLWDIDINNYYAGAVTDVIAYIKKPSWVDNLPLPEGFLYVNTGVMMFNLKKWREDNIEKKLFENSVKYADVLRLTDQDVFNITLASRIKYLPQIFNVTPVLEYFNPEQEKEAFTNPLIIHWAGPLKPWKNPGYKMADIFWKYARKTPFYDEILCQNVNKYSLTKLDISVSDKIKYSIKNLLDKCYCRLYAPHFIESRF